MSTQRRRMPEPRQQHLPESAEAALGDMPRQTVDTTGYLGNAGSHTWRQLCGNSLAVKLMRTLVIPAVPTNSANARLRKDWREGEAQQEEVVCPDNPLNQRLRAQQQTYKRNCHLAQTLEPKTRKMLGLSFPPSIRFGGGVKKRRPSSHSCRGRFSFSAGHFLIMLLTLQIATGMLICCRWTWPGQGVRHPRLPTSCRWATFWLPELR